MDFLVTENTITTESIFDPSYPGLEIYEMSNAQREAVRIAKESLDKSKGYLSPIESDDEILSDASDNNSDGESDNELLETTKEGVSRIENKIEQHIKNPEDKDRILEDRKLSPVNNVSNNQSGVSNNQSGVSNNQSGVSNNQSGVSNNQSGVSNNQSGVSNNQSGVSNNHTSPFNMNLNNNISQSTNINSDVLQPNTSIYKSQEYKTNKIENSKYETGRIHESDYIDKNIFRPSIIQSNLITSIPESISTPHIFSHIPQDKSYDELKKEVCALRKQVALSVNMQSFINKLEGIDDTSIEIDYIKVYAKRKFNIIINDSDFSSLTAERVHSMYQKTKQADKSDRYEVLYKTAFDFCVNHLEGFINNYLFSINGLNQFLVYDDISTELDDIKKQFEKSVLSKYVSDTSSYTRLICYFGIQILRAKFKY